MTIDRDLWNQIVKTLKSTIAFISVGSILRILLFPAAVIAEVEPQALISPESIRVHHDALVNISSKAGGLNSGVRLNEAGNLAAQYLLNGYKEAGLENVRFEPFYPNRWWPESYDLTIIGDQNTPDQ
ncbi:MAG: hypothetical protein P8Y38_12455, partial [Deltaproteobacteria bacterium]